MGEVKVQARAYDASEAPVNLAQAGGHVIKVYPADWRSALSPRIHVHDPHQNLHTHVGAGSSCELFESCRRQIPPIRVRVRVRRVVNVAYLLAAMLNFSHSRGSS